MPMAYFNNRHAAPGATRKVVIRSLAVPAKRLRSLSNY